MRVARLVLLWGLVQTPAFAQDSEERPSVFRYGSSCGQLAQLTRQEIVGVIHPAHSEHFAQFCVPDGVYSCADYDALLEGAGQLEDNGQGMCRLTRSENP
jgi:hypothetical protein